MDLTSLKPKKRLHAPLKVSYNSTSSSPFAVRPLASGLPSQGSCRPIAARLKRVTETLKFYKAGVLTLRLTSSFHSVLLMSILGISILFSIILKSILFCPRAFISISIIFIVYAEARSLVLQTLSYTLFHHATEVIKMSGSLIHLDTPSSLP